MPQLSRDVSPELYDQCTVSEFKCLDSPEEPPTSVLLSLHTWGNTCVLKYANRYSGQKKVFSGQRPWKNQGRGCPSRCERH